MIFLTEDFEENCLELATALSVFNENPIHDQRQWSKEPLATACPDGPEQRNNEADCAHANGWQPRFDYKMVCEVTLRLRLSAARRLLSKDGAIARSTRISEVTMASAQ
jgi:hypothetical protein